MSVANATSTATPSWFASPELLALTLSGIIAVVVSLVATFMVQSYLDRPKLKGNILQVIIGHLVGNFDKTSYAMYVYLTNQHQNTISIFDYEMYVDFGEGYIKLDRVFGTGIIPEVFEASSPLGNARIENFRDKQLSKKDQQIGFGNFIDGFLMFVGDPSFLKKQVNRYKLVCIDVFQRKHIIEVAPKEFPQGLVWADRAGVKFDRPIDLSKSRV